MGVVKDFIFKDRGITEAVGSLFGIPNDPYTGKSQLLGPTIGSNSGQIIPSRQYLQTRQTAQSGQTLGTKSSNQNRGQQQQSTQQSTSGSGSTGPSQGDVDAIYNPVADFLNQMQSEYEAQRPGAEANIESSFGRQLTPINEKEQTELGIQNTQEGNINREEANALAQARQVYNELQQRNIALYGTGSSAGPAASEILGRSTARQFGQIGESATAGRTTVEAERGNIKKFAEQKRVDLKSQKEEAIRALQIEFRNGLLQIGQMRAQNESAKAAARLDLLQRVQEQAFQIEQADKAYQRAIDQFERESAVTAASNQQFSSLRGTDSATANQFSQILANPNLSTAQKYVQGIQLGIDPKLVGSIIGTSQKDKEDELAAPNFGV